MIMKTFILRPELTPFSFDFFWLCQNIKLYCRVHNIEKAAVTMQPMDKFIPVFGRGVQTNFYGLMQPILKMLDIEESKSTDFDCETPENNMSTWAEAYRRHGWVPPKLNHWLDLTDFEGCITITLRECEYQADRNSNILEWLELGKWLQGKGHRVIIIRDTAMSYEPIKGFETMPSASVDLRFRTYAYYKARMNLGVANGPMVIPTATNDVPYIWNVGDATISMTENRHKGFSVMQVGDIKPKGEGECDVWEAWLGMPKGEQVPWASKKQKVIWGNDTCRAFQEALDGMDW